MAKLRTLTRNKSAFMLSRCNETSVHVGILQAHFFCILKRLRKCLLVFVYYHSIMFIWENITITIKFPENGLLWGKQVINMLLSKCHSLQNTEFHLNSAFWRSTEISQIEAIFEHLQIRIRFNQFQTVVYFQFLFTNCILRWEIEKVLSCELWFFNWFWFVLIMVIVWVLGHG